MNVDLMLAKRMRRPARPDFATLVAVIVARQSASPTAQLIAAADGRPAGAADLVDPFGAAAARGPLQSGCFNSGVAALLIPRQRT